MPLALAVVFAMLASYLLSRTLVPVMADYLLPAETRRNACGRAGPSGPQRASCAASIAASSAASSASATATCGCWTGTCTTAGRSRASFSRPPPAGFCCPPWAQISFPPSMPGQFRLHVRAPAGTRLEQTQQLLQPGRGGDPPRSSPRDEVELVLDNIGLPNRTYSMAFGDSSTTGMADGEILVALKHRRRRSTPEYVAELRRELPRKFPAFDLLFPVGRHRQPDPQFRPAGPDRHRHRGPRPREELRAGHARSPAASAAIRGVQDVHVHQVVNVPSCTSKWTRPAPRSWASRRHDVANNVLVSLSGSGQVLPNYWVDPDNGISYLVETRTPHYRRSTSIDAIESMPIPSTGDAEPQLLSNIANVERRITPGGDQPRRTSSRCTTCMPTCRAATWAAWPGEIDTDPRRVSGRAWRRATRSPCGARWRACSRPSCAWGSG